MDCNLVRSSGVVTNHVINSVPQVIVQMSVSFVEAYMSCMLTRFPIVAGILPDSLLLARDLQQAKTVYNTSYLAPGRLQRYWMVKRG